MLMIDLYDMIIETNWMPNDLQRRILNLLERQAIHSTGDSQS